MTLSTSFTDVIELIAAFRISREHPGFRMVLTCAIRFDKFNNRYCLSLLLKLDTYQRHAFSLTHKPFPSSLAVSLCRPGSHGLRLST